jgi:hypothetical protein
MLYTLEKTFHEQTLSFAAQDPNEKLVERCSPTSEFLEDIGDWYPCSLWGRCAGGDRILRLLDLQAYEGEAQSGRSSFPDTGSNPRAQSEGYPFAAYGSEQSAG